MKRIILPLACALAFTTLPTFAKEPLFVQVPAAFDPSAPIPAAVKNECAVDMLLGNHALSAVGKSGFPAQSATSQEQAGKDKFVQLTVLSVHGFGGGAWSGAKSMAVRADLKQGSSTLRSTVLSRSSTGGAFSAFKGTCEILDRVAVALGKDVAKWVSQPTGAPQGDEPVAAIPPQEDAK